MWRTPQTEADIKESRRVTGHKERIENHQPALANQVQVNWLTPKAPSRGGCPRNTPGGGLRKLEDQTEVNWPTPTDQDAKKNAGPSQYDRNTQPLNVAAGLPAPDSPSTNGKSQELWPTPSHGSSEGGQGIGLSGGSGNRKKLQRIMGEDITHKLNPAWVSSLQGIPAYWVKIIDFTDETPYTMVDLTERNNYETSYKILCLLSEAIRTQTVQWEIGRSFCFLAQEILRQDMLRKGDTQRGCTEVGIAQEGKQITWENLRELWHREGIGHPPQRHEYQEQQQGQPDDSVCEAPYKMALGEWEKQSEAIAANLLCLRENMPYSCWDVSGSLPEAEEIWRSASDAETYQWFVATCQRLIYWQESQQTSRVDELRLLGNGVVPQCAEKAMRELGKL